MAEEADGQKLNDIGLEPQHGAPDWFLAALVGIANSGASFGITLQVGGFLVSGTLVGGVEYFEGFASDFASAFSDPELAEEYRTAFAAGAEHYRNVPEDKRSNVSYVHLKEARFFNTSGKPIPGNRGVWWRGRLSEVSGFVLGSLSLD